MGRRIAIGAAMTGCNDGLQRLVVTEPTQTLQRHACNDRCRCSKSEAKRNKGRRPEDDGDLEGHILFTNGSGDRAKRNRSMTLELWYHESLYFSLVFVCLSHAYTSAIDSTKRNNRYNFYPNGYIRAFTTQGQEARGISRGLCPLPLWNFLCSTTQGQLRGAWFLKMLTV